MEIVKLPFGEEAPANRDSISIWVAADGTHQLDGSALLACGDSDEVESVAMIGSKPYGSYEEAEAAGLAWAADHCVEQLYVTTMPADRRNRTE